MDPDAPQRGYLPPAYEAAAAQERRLWTIFQDPDLQAAERLVAYARWRAAARRLNELALELGLPGADSRG